MKFRRAPTSLAPCVVVCALVGLAFPASPTAASSQPASTGLELFVSGPLANADHRTVSGTRAAASILAVTGGGTKSGIASIEVMVDGDRVAGHRIRCRNMCPRSATFTFHYNGKRFGPSAHVVTIRATDADGNDLEHTITLEKKGLGKKSGAPGPVPAFYMTALTANKLNQQAADAAAQVAKKQDSGHTLLAMDFGAARLKHGTYGTSLRNGPFFSNEEIAKALRAAAVSYHQNYRRGSVTIVYANSNGHISESKSGYTKLNPATARKAGEAQGKVIDDLKLYAHESSAVGGDIEPGYDKEPKLSVAMVKGAVAGANPPRYYDFGTAPCKGQKCINGWLVKHLCDVTTGPRRAPLPEIYNVRPTDPSAEWRRIEKTCRIKSFAGVSANLLGDLSPAQSWLRLNERTHGRIGDALVVWPK